MGTWKKLPETLYEEKPLVKDIIKLDANENPYPPPQEVIESINRVLKYINRYPPEPRKLREAIAKLNGLNDGNVILGAGSDELIDLIVKAYVYEGANVAVLYPTFPMYERFTLIAGGSVVKIPLNPDFTFNLDAIIQTLSSKDIKVFFMPNPNNPTGLGPSLEQIEEVLKIAVLTVVDEAYYEFSAKTALNLLKNYENLIILRTFSKAYGLAGLRIGYGLASEQVVENLLKVKPPYNVSLIAQEAALTLLENRHIVDFRIETIRKARDSLYESLKRFKRIKPYPSEANFILIDVSGSGLSSKQVSAGLLEHGISVRVIGVLSGFQGDFIRITVGTDYENTMLIEALKKILGSKGG
ncbi:histidinol-phosphate transaminase [Candidatus Bathyarchaeota archaeon]|nr:histidinol-phosphate transaminase [Candidatus Bathyarchaeota archaeon]MBS7612813.1 histidinol-phosphate transaminase [Candidatus Bathyarchaeota archaeon]